MKFFVSCLLALSTFWVQASPIPDFPFVTVTGESSRQVAPDSAKLGFRITTFHQSSEVAHAQLTQASNKVLALLKANGIKDSQITAFELDKSARRRRDDSYNNLEVLGYELDRGFMVNLHDLQVYQALVTQLYATENVHSLSTRFDTKERDNIETVLLGAATAEARKKAEQMAEGLGVKIHSVFAFNDKGSFQEFFATFGLQAERMGVQHKPSFDSGAPEVFIPQSIEISKTVNVIYKITP